MGIRAGVQFNGFLTSSIDLGSVTWNTPALALTDLPQGTGSGQADLVYADTRTIAASGTYSLDLVGTQDVNVFGVANAFAKIKGIWIYAATGNTNSVVVGNGTNPFVGPFSAGTITITIPPGGELLLTAPVGGWTTTGGASDILKLANSGSGTGVDVSTIIWGTSA